MKKKISRWLLKAAKWLNPSILLENTAYARPMGICIHISKKDVRSFRKEHPEIKSHREGLRVLVNEAKWRVAGAIGRGLMEQEAIDFDVKKTIYVADVSGIAYVYGGKENNDEAESDDSEA